MQICARNCSWLGSVRRRRNPPTSDGSRSVGVTAPLLHRFPPEDRGPVSRVPRESHVETAIACQARCREPAGRLSSHYHQRTNDLTECITCASARCGCNCSRWLGGNIYGELYHLGLRLTLARFHFPFMLTGAFAPLPWKLRPEQHVFPLEDAHGDHEGHGGVHEVRSETDHERRGGVVAGED
jgi:hypothetical protein